MSITFGGNPVTIEGEKVKVNDKLKNFKATKKDLSVFDFYNETDSKVKVISVAPSLDTGVCAFQTEEFNKKIEELKDKVTLITITVDLPFAQKRFCDSHSIDNSITVSDYKNLDFGKKYGFLIKEFRLLTRGVLIANEENVVKYVEYVDEVTNHIDYDKAMEHIKSLV